VTETSPGWNTSPKEKWIRDQQGRSREGGERTWRAAQASKALSVFS
jgi:hypothetical protein